MATKNEQFITQMKLRELSIQRDRLSRAYNNLDQRVQQETTETGRLRLLSEGLRGLTFAEQKLHPDIANMEPLSEPTEGEPISAETLTFWRERLEKERASGLLRSEIMYTFGALLEEWASAPINTDPESEQIQATLIERRLQPATTGNYTALLDSLIADLAFGDEDERVRQFQKAVGNTLRQSVNVSNLVATLEQVSTNVYHSAELRKQAQDFLADTTMQKELADALTIMLEHLDEWQRPQEGYQTHTLWTYTKWRLCIDEDLPTVCFLEILGQRWQRALERFFLADCEARVQSFRYHHQHLINRIFNHQFQGLRPSKIVEIDIWDPGQTRPTTEDFLSRLETGSIMHLRMREKRGLRDLDQLSSYDMLDKISNIENALALINAEIALARALPSTRPLHILKIDFKDFYPSLSHQLLLDILQRYGASSSQLAFFQTFFQIPLTYRGETRASSVGIPNYCQLSHLLGELVTGLFEHYLERSAQVQIIRAIDDICILGTSADEMNKAWQAIGTFCEAFGLTLNQEKCGSTCIGGERLPFLPDTQPEWSLLTLDNQGDWQINWNAFDRYLEQARQHVTQSSSLISQIETYNAHLAYLVNALAMHANLGSSHRKGINAAMERFSQSFFGPGKSIVSTARQLIHERFLKQGSNTPIPEAWLYWPITAGGCGLLQATILASGFNDRERQSRREPPKEHSADWQYKYNSSWSTFYNFFTETSSAHEPETNQIMETLVQDFIKRGSEVSNREQESLSPYWRWILYIYGPQILDSLGTFRFLITELVPLQLIVKKYHEQGEEI